MGFNASYESITRLITPIKFSSNTDFPGRERIHCSKILTLSAHLIYNHPPVLSELYISWNFSPNSPDTSRAGYVVSYLAAMHTKFNSSKGMFMSIDSSNKCPLQTPDPPSLTILTTPHLPGQ